MGAKTTAVTGSVGPVLDEELAASLADDACAVASEPEPPKVDKALVARLVAHALGEGMGLDDENSLLALDTREIKEHRQNDRPGRSFGLIFPASMSACQRLYAS